MMNNDSDSDYYWWHAGPVNIHENVQRAMARPPSNHRDPWFPPFYLKLLEDTKIIFGTTKGTTIIFPGECLTQPMMFREKRKSIFWSVVFLYLLNEYNLSLKCQSDPRPGVYAWQILYIWRCYRESRHSIALGMRGLEVGNDDGLLYIQLCTLIVETSKKDIKQRANLIWFVLLTHNHTLTFRHCTVSFLSKLALFELSTVRCACWIFLKHFVQV